MLKKRIIAVLLVKDGIVVQSIGFKRYLPIGKPAIAIEFLNDWGVDSIIWLDISAGRNRSNPDISLIKGAAKYSRVPLAVGGGIQTLDHVKELIHSGADKVSFNQASLHHPELLTETARIFGNQCVIASIDAISTPDGHKVYDYHQGRPTDLCPAKLAEQMQLRGAGEILINSVDRDGSYLGFDIELTKNICQAVTIPVICCGGAGKPEHFAEAFKHTNVQAAAAGNIFHFSEHSVTTIKASVKKATMVRLDTHMNYEQNEFDDFGRLIKKDDKHLEDLLYIRIEKEII